MRRRTHRPPWRRNREKNSSLFSNVRVPRSDHVRRSRSRTYRDRLSLFYARTRRGDAVREVRPRRGSRAKPPAQAVGLVLERPSKPALPRTFQHDADLQPNQPVRGQKLARSDRSVDGAWWAGPKPSGMDLGLGLPQGRPRAASRGLCRKTASARHRASRTQPRASGECNIIMYAVKPRHASWAAVERAGGASLAGAENIGCGAVA